MRIVAARTAADAICGSGMARANGICTVRAVIIQSGDCEFESGTPQLLNCWTAKMGSCSEVAGTVCVSVAEMPANNLGRGREAARWMEALADSTVFRPVSRRVII